MEPVNEVYVLDPATATGQQQENSSINQISHVTLQSGKAVTKKKTFNSSSINLHVISKSLPVPVSGRRPQALLLLVPASGRRTQAFPSACACFRTPHTGLPPCLCPLRDAAHKPFFFPSACACFRTPPTGSPFPACARFGTPITSTPPCPCLFQVVSHGPWTFQPNWLKEASLLAKGWVELCLNSNGSGYGSMEL